MDRLNINDKVIINSNFHHGKCLIDSLSDIIDNDNLDFSKVDPSNIIGMAGVIIFVAPCFIRIKFDIPLFNLEEYCFDYEELTKIEESKNVAI